MALAVSPPNISFIVTTVLETPAGEP